MNSNIVKIGKALKWRGVYDDSKKYYAENIITCYGGVFRCNVSVAQGIPPYELNEDGLPTIQNTETWTCLVDTTWIIEWVLAFKKFKDEATARFEVNEEHIAKHCDMIAQHQESIDSLDDSVASLVQKDAEHDESLQTLSETLGDVSDKVDANEESINDLSAKIDDSALTLGQLEEKINQTNERITTEIGSLNAVIEAQNETIAQHSNTIYLLSQQIVELQEQLELMSKYNCCFSTGVWDNGLYYVNDGLWNNGGGSSEEETITEMTVSSYDEETGNLGVEATVITYSEETGTLYVIDETNTYDESTGTLHIDDALLE